MAKTRVAMQERKETRDANTRERIKENEITLCDNENEFATCWCHKIQKLFA